MIFYRICKTRYAKDLNGKGAEKLGGRWNSIGVPIVYVSDSIAACILEIAVHQPLGIMPKNYSLITFQLPENTSISEIKMNGLVKNWSSSRNINLTQEIGDRFSKENKHLVLKVPSASAQGGFNHLINPNHSDFKKIKIKKIEPFGFDNRLFSKS